MSLVADPDRAHVVASALHEAFTPVGIFGKTSMPEDELPAGVERGSLEHRLFITLTVSIDYQRDAHELWRAARAAFSSNETRCLFDPEQVHLARFAATKASLVACGLSRKPAQDAHTWYTVAVTFFKKWDGDPDRFLADCGYDGPEALARLAAGCHSERAHDVPDFPFLRGPKIGPLWLRMLRDNVGIKLKGMDRVPIPVDIHVARATLATGVLRGTYTGTASSVFDDIRTVWHDGVKGLSVGDREMIALDVDEPLWHLSKFGCSHRRDDGTCARSAECPVVNQCVRGKVSMTSKGRLEVVT